MSKPFAIRRPWLQFGLGTVFLVVTAFAIWLGWELSFIRQRQAWLRVHDSWGLDSQNFQSAVPRWRLIMGDTNVHWILLPLDVTQEELAEANRLFPEAGSISLVQPEK
ncbi:MAG TPA: hypothetical protein VGN12_12330 [Pirellulales bacterium]|jgi:hypothetical protein